MLIFCPVACAEAVKSIEEIDVLQKKELSQLEQDFNQSIEDLQNRKNQEIEIVKSSQAVEKSKTKMISGIEIKYAKQQQSLEAKYESKKNDLIKYYQKLEKEILSAIPEPQPEPVKQQNTQVASEPQPQIPVYFIPPQKLIDNWEIRAGKYLGTIRFLNSEGVFVAQVRFFMYNKWDDVFNLTYDGQYIAFDYENPYGVRLHFQGMLNKDANSIRGEFLDINTKEELKWHAFR